MHNVSNERVLSGIKVLDEMLEGKGYYRGSTVLVSGTAGVGKTRIAAHFAEAAFKYEVADCDSVVKFSNLSQRAVSYTWNFGDEEESTMFSPVHTYSLSGTIPVTLISTSSNARPDTIVQDFIFVSRKKQAFSSTFDSCYGRVHIGGFPTSAK